MLHHGPVRRPPSQPEQITRVPRVSWYVWRPSRGQVSETHRPVCKSVAKASEVRILDLPPPARTALDQRKCRSGAVLLCPGTSGWRWPSTALRVLYPMADVWAITPVLLSGTARPDRRPEAGLLLPYGRGWRLLARRADNDQALGFKGRRCRSGEVREAGRTAPQSTPPESTAPGAPPVPTSAGFGTSWRSPPDHPHCSSSTPTPTGLVTRSSECGPHKASHLRRMWVGRDLGYDLDLWWRAQQTHQAVAWWMYVAVVADDNFPAEPTHPTPRRPPRPAGHGPKDGQGAGRAG